MKSTVLVLDWSNLLYRSLFINQIFHKNISYNDKEDVNSFIRKFSTDILYVLKIFNPQNVIIATDAKNPWRKDILADAEIGYKGNRSHDDSFNWENIFAATNELLKIFEKFGVNVANVERAEADDIIAMCKETVFEKFPNYNMIIVSADADVQQLIDFKPDTHQFCIAYNTIAKGNGGARHLYAPKGFIEWINAPEQNDIFFSNTIDSAKTYIKGILSSNANIKLVEENGNDIVLKKIFCGDDGDSVPAFYEWFDNGKKKRVTPARYSKIVEALSVNDTKSLCEKSILLEPVMKRILKLDMNDIDFNDRLNRQRALVELNSSLFPTNIKNYKDTIAYMFNTTSTSDFRNMTFRELLEGTEYVSQYTSKVEKQVFKDVEKYAKNLQKLF